MRAASLPLFILCLSSCVLDDPCPFDEWLDPATNAAFVGVEPTCEDAERWFLVWKTTADLWGRTPEPMRVWFVYSTDQLIYYDGEVRPWPTGLRGLSRWRFGRPPDLYVLAIHQPSATLRMLIHEMTHIHWRISDCHTAEFKALEEALIVAVFEQWP